MCIQQKLTFFLCFILDSVVLQKPGEPPFMKRTPATCWVERDRFLGWEEFSILEEVLERYLLAHESLSPTPFLLLLFSFLNSHFYYVVKTGVSLPSILFFLVNSVFYSVVKMGESLRSILFCLVHSVSF